MPCSGFTITPSRPAPSKRVSQSAATRAIARHRREVDRRRGVGQRQLEAAPSFDMRAVAQILAVDREQVEGDERRGARLRELRDA